MIDKGDGRSLDFVHFGVPGTGWRSFVRVLVLVLLAVAGTGCFGASDPKTVEDSVTSGRISVMCSPEIFALIENERAAFDSIYPGATIVLMEGTSTQGVRALFAAECDLAAISRELEPVERSAAMQGGLELEGYRFAVDGVTLVVHPGNPVENMALDEVRGVFDGTLTRWSAIGGADEPIRPVIQAPESDIMAYFTGSVMNGEPIRAPVVYQPSDSAVVAFVARQPQAMGIVSMAWSERGVKPLRLAALKGLSYWRPDAETVHRGEYPLSRNMTLYVRPTGPALANGLITFIMSGEGQTIVRDAGLVPTAVPLRFVRRSPMVGSHR